MARLSTMRSDFSTELKGYIEAMVVKEVDKIIEKHKEQMQTEIDEVRQEVIAKSALRIARYTDLQQMGDKLIITVENPSHPTNTN